MAVTILSALAMVESWREGARFDATLTLGRIDCAMTMHDLQRVARLLPEDSGFVKAVARGQAPKYMDDFFRAMGAASVEALDANAFEGASIIHDLNEPLPATLHGRFDAVIDSGTLEHVFNAPTAFRNAMDALKVGGSFLAILPANNWCGHGFYQFSAEFFFRTFSPENGFEVRKLLVAPAYVGGRWVDGPAYEVSDPHQMRDRVQIASRHETVFLLHARKVKARDVFAAWPQQSDYAETWLRSAATAAEQAPDLAPVRGRVARPFATRIKRLTRIGSIRRAIQRYRGKRAWVRQCRRNPALRPHRWTAEP